MKELNCLVTGASSGIGKEISIKLSAYAKHIYICSRNVKKLEDVHDKIIENNCECTIVPMNLCDENVIENLAKQIQLKDTSLDILVLSAGIINQLSPVDSIDLENFKNIISLNFLSNFRMIKSFHSLLKSSNSAYIAAVSSLKDPSKEYYWGIYQPIMTALNELLLTYSKENKDTNIKTNIFCPLAVNTKLRDVIIPGEDKSKISDPKDIATKIVNYILEADGTGKIIEIT
tara:strand:- start:533 stop:1225 length:693 start_codon:yes stop_codon:yes gene_type:complete